MNASPHTGGGKHLPRLVFWEVTKGCNLRCVHCRATATELASPNDLPTGRCLDIIDQIAAFSDPILVLSGGDPIYRPDIFILAKYATDKGLRVALATNGTLVTKDVAQKIVEAGVQRVSISLDGACAETHDEFRGIPGSFEAAIYGLRNLKELGVRVQINATIAHHNAAELPKVLEMVRGLGADAPPSCWYQWAVEAVMPGSSEMAIKNNPDGQTGADPSAVNAISRDCLAGTGVCFISFEGEVYSCGNPPAMAGDLRKQSFAEIWNKSAAFAEQREADKLEGKCCRELRSLCMGCRARAYAANGNSMAEEPFCVYEPKAMATK